MKPAQTIRGLPPDLSSGQHEFTRWELARALHCTAPHGGLHPWEGCPQRRWDELQADAILDTMRRLRVKRPHCCSEPSSCSCQTEAEAHAACDCTATAATCENPDCCEFCHGRWAAHVTPVSEAISE